MTLNASVARLALAQALSGANSTVVYATGAIIGNMLSPRPELATLTGMAALAGISGMTVHHFWIALVLLGVGWNFGFLGASAMVLTCHRPEEGPRVQSLNDFVVFGAMVVGSFVSGSLLAAFGWAMVSSLILPPVVVAAAALLWLQRTSVEPSRQL
ncbi:Drug transport transmembrane protein (fragment) [Cupriavidus taiwanensis]|uniref:Drug transport transmembrane protein n=1 Tax=Cupriavidus taiwanensis TaxID=164546 RepID=A0A375BYN5_9BURK